MTSPNPEHPKIPTLFQPLQIRDLTLRNRIVVSPMGMYSSSPSGALTSFHVMHHGTFAQRGAALTMVEVTAVLPNGRSSPADAGLWSDAQTPSFKRVVDFVHRLEPAAGGRPKIGIQLGHAGRKASMQPIYPGFPVVRAEKKDGGWPDEVWGASAVAFKPNYVVPKEMSEEDITEVVDAFGAAARRAVEAGFDLIEIHAAHGYLLSSFLSPASNTRHDTHGGSLENRAHILLRVVASIRASIPSSMPLSVRISATDWMQHSPETPQFKPEDAETLAVLLADAGVDVLDVSSGGNNAEQQVPGHAGYQTDLATQIKKHLREAGRDMVVAGVGRIGDARTAERVVEDVDLAFVATGFLREAGLVYKWAEELGVGLEWSRQYVRADRGAKMGTL